MSRCKGTIRSGIAFMGTKITKLSNNMDGVHCSEDGREDSVLLIKKWIFEHACKYGMNDVMRALFLKNGSKSLSQLDDVSLIKPNPAFMFVTLVEIFQETLKGEDMVWDNTFLIMITEILEDLYKKNNFVPIKRFMNAVTRLKLMELLKLMTDGTDSSDVVRRVNIHFPRWDKNTQNTIQEQYKISNPISLKKTEKTMVACRRFILELLVSKEKWKNYQKNSYSRDMRQFAEAVNKELVEMMNVLRPELPPSPIEQVLNGAKEDLANSDDAAIQILLEHLHTGMDEEEFLKLLDILEPETESQINPAPFASFLDGINESISIADEKIISGEESNTSTVVFADESHSKDNDSPEVLPLEKEPSFLYQTRSKHRKIFLDELSNEKDSSPSLISSEKTQKFFFQDPEKERKKNEKEQNVNTPEKRKKGRSHRIYEVVIPSSNENSDSEIEILPDFGCYLVKESVKPCIVKLSELTILKRDGFRYQIYS